MKFLFFTLLITASLCLRAQTGSEILIFSLKSDAHSVSIDQPRNITNRPGYDNQPSFHPVLPLIYYASIEDKRSDIKVYDFDKYITRKLTQTNEKEYSPLVTPDRKYVSCIIQRDSGAQDLGKYPIQSGEPQILINDLIVGYHAWINPKLLALFILGKNNTLQLYDLDLKQSKEIVSNPGRSIHKMKNIDAISFIEKKNQDEWVISKYDVKSHQITPIVTTPKGSEDYCWLPDGKILITADTKIYFFDPNHSTGWTEIIVSEGKDLIKGATRISVNADGTRLAVVIAE